MMNQIITPNEKWEIQKVKLKTMFPHLNEEDFRFDYEQKALMMSNLQVKLEKTSEEINDLLEQLGQF